MPGRTMGRERIRAGLLAGAVGDAMGWAIDERTGAHPHNGRPAVPVGAPVSALTRLASGCARALTRCRPTGAEAALTAVLSGADQTAQAGPGVLAPAAVIGLGRFDFDETYRLARAVAAHSEPCLTAQTAAGVLALLLERLTTGMALPEAVEAAADHLRGHDSVPAARGVELLLRDTLQRSRQPRPDPARPATPPTASQAAAALATGLYCALTESGTVAALRRACLLPVGAAPGLPSSAAAPAAVCGHLIGTANGIAEIPRPWLAALEGSQPLGLIGARFADRWVRVGLEREAVRHGGVEPRRLAEIRVARLSRTTGIPGLEC